MGIDGLNNFGSLTTQNGKRLTFKDFDLNRDGQISEEEFNTVLKDNKIDTVELSSIDKNEDKIITQEEFSLMEMEARVNEDYLRIIDSLPSRLFGANEKYIPQVTANLKAFAEGLIEKLKNNPQAYNRNDLYKAYEQIMNDVVWNNPQVIKSRVLDEVYDAILPELSVPYDMKDIVATELLDRLQPLADEYIKTHPNYSSYDMFDYLMSQVRTMMDRTDAYRMKNDVKEYRDFYKSLGGYKDESDFEVLKDAAVKLIQSALDKGIEVMLNGVKITSQAQMKELIGKYNTAQELNADIENFINSLSNENPVTVILNRKIAEADEKTIADLNGENCTIPHGYRGDAYEYAAFAMTIPSSEDSNDRLLNVKNCFKNILTSEQTTRRVKVAFYQQLKNNGILNPERFEELFAGVYSQSVEYCLNNINYDTLRGITSYLEGSSYYIDISELMRIFIDKFNENIVIAINILNNPEPDFEDIDYKALVTDDEGNVDEEMLGKLESGASIIGTSDDVTEKFGKMIDKLKPSMLSKSMTLCKRNGVDFNNKSFNKIFDKSKFSAMNNSMVDLYFICIAKPQQLLTNFAESFEANYKEWIESEKLNKNSF